MVITMARNTMGDKHQDTLQEAARHLLQHPLTCAEHHADLFNHIRRHEQALDRWFTQRLGYRLQVNSFTARLFKSTVVPHRPVLPAPVGSGRALSQRECTLLVLILAAVAAGPRVISLRDLIDDVRSEATDAEITLSTEASERRALVVALKWMVKHGLVKELHEHIDKYEQDDAADAILEIDFDRIGMLPLPVLGRVNSAAELLDRSDRRTASRQWMRAMLTENPVLYRTDLSDAEWSQLRRRLGDEVALLDEMFGLRLESRAEGVAAIDHGGQLSDRNFPAAGTVGHAALLVIDCLLKLPEQTTTKPQLHSIFTDVVEQHKRHWSKTRVEHPQTLLRDALELLADMRLAVADTDIVSLLPAASRYSVKTSTVSPATSDNGDDPESDGGNDDQEQSLPDPSQASLW